MSTTLALKVPVYVDVVISEVILTLTAYLFCLLNRATEPFHLLLSCAFQLYIYLLKILIQLGVVAHAFNSRTQEAGTGGSLEFELNFWSTIRVQGSQDYTRNCLQTNKQNYYFK